VLPSPEQAFARFVTPPRLTMPPAAVQRKASVSIDIPIDAPTMTLPSLFVPSASAKADPPGRSPIAIGTPPTQRQASRCVASSNHPAMTMPSSEIAFAPLLTQPAGPPNAVSAIVPAMPVMAS
jgi:hypothetical protein